MCGVIMSVAMAWKSVDKGALLWRH